MRRGRPGVLLLAMTLGFVVTFFGAGAGAGAAAAHAALPDLPVPEHSAEQAHTAAKKVLDGAEFKRPPKSIIQRVRDWIGRQLSVVLGEVIGSGSPAIVAWVILAAAAAVLTWLVVRFARGVTADAAQPLNFARPTLRSPQDWRSEALAHERNGEWRAALRCRYRALVADLAGRGLVDEVPGRTTGEYRAEVGENVPRVAPEFAGATELFEAAWYGNRPTGEEESQRFRRLADQVMAGAR